MSVNCDGQMLPKENYFMSCDTIDSVQYVPEVISMPTDTVQVEKKNERYAYRSKYTVDQVMEAMMWVESKFNEKIVSRDGSSVGILQITPICVKQCNILAKRKGLSVRYKNTDRLNKAKSIEMFKLIQEASNPQFDIRKAVNLWNAGNANKYIRATERYYNKVMNYLKSHYN